MFSVPVSKTKIVPPRRRPELLSRKRLLDMLFEALDKKLTLVSAPAGYGKTSLLVDFVHQDAVPCSWLALDELDREPQRFAAYFIAALAERFPNFGAQSRNVLEGMNSFEGELERLAVTLVNELYDQVKEHFVFILDDFHILEDIQPIQNFVNRFVQLADDNCHLIISSRTLTSLTDLPLFIARDQVSGLSYSELAFQQEELQALLARNGGLHLSDEEAERLIMESEGWITGLQFSNSGIMRIGAKRSVLEVGHGTDLFDYLGQQVLDRQPPELREFVLRTSLLEEFDAALCRTVLAPFYPEGQDWQGWIKSITRNNLFALPIGEDGRWLRYHHLFRDFIRERFERERPHEIEPILSRLQKAYEGMGEWVKAHHTCRKLGDVDALSELIERAGRSMLVSAHLTVENWLNDLPPSMLRTRPALLSLRGVIAQLKGNSAESLRLLEQAEESFREKGGLTDLALVLIRKATSNRLLADYAASLQNAEEAIHITDGRDDLREFHADALRVKGLALFRLGQAKQAVASLEESLTIHTRLNETSQIPALLMETGMVYRAIGNFSQAQNFYEKALQIWQREGNLFWQANLLNNLGGLYHAMGDYEKAAQAFEEGLLCAQRSHHARFEGLLSISLGDLYTELEDFEMAQENYRRAEEILLGMTDRFLSHSLSFSRATLAVTLKNNLFAASILEQVEGSVLAGSSKHEKSLLEMIYGRLYLLEGNTREALKELHNAEARLMEDDREVEAFVARVWLAASYARAGDPGRAVQILTDLNAQKGKIPHAVLVALHQAGEWLLGEEKSAGIIGRAARDLFSQVKRFEEKIPGIRRQLRRQARVVSRPDPHFVIQAFGTASVKVAGRMLAKSDWQTQSVRELFFFLLSSPLPLTKEKICETLWQDQYETAKMKLRFKNELYRLRRAAGQEAILFKDDRYSFNRNLDYEYDVEAFEAFLARAKNAEDPKTRTDFLRKAVDLAQGPYLNDLYADWVIPERERLGQAYLNALLEVSTLYLKQAQLEDCIAASQRAVKFDPGCEPAYQVGMQAYARLGDRAGVKRTYQACRDAMQSQFNLPPSKETEELYTRLMK